MKGGPTALELFTPPTNHTYTTMAAAVPASDSLRSVREAIMSALDKDHAWLYDKNSGQEWAMTIARSGDLRQAVDRLQQWGKAIAPNIMTLFVDLGARGISPPMDPIFDLPKDQVSFASDDAHKQFDNLINHHYHDDPKPDEGGVGHDLGTVALLRRIITWSQVTPKASRDIGQLLSDLGRLTCPMQVHHLACIVACVESTLVALTRGHIIKGTDPKGALYQSLILDSVLGHTVTKFLAKLHDKTPKSANERAQLTRLQWQLRSHSPQVDYHLLHTLSYLCHISSLGGCEGEAPPSVIQIQNTWQEKCRPHLFGTLSLKACAPLFQLLSAHPTMSKGGTKSAGEKEHHHLADGTEEVGEHSVGIQACLNNGEPSGEGHLRWLVLCEIEGSLPPCRLCEFVLSTLVLFLMSVVHPPPLLSVLNPMHGHPQPGGPSPRPQKCHRLPVHTTAGVMEQTQSVAVIDDHSVLVKQQTFLDQQLKTLCLTDLVHKTLLELIKKGEGPQECFRPFSC